MVSASDLPIAKAFSPDGRRLAATVFLHAGVRRARRAASARLPMLYLFDTSGTEPPVIIASAALQDEVTLGGHGLDWSPNGSLLAWPSTVNSAYYVNGVLSGGVTSTGIYLRSAVGEYSGPATHVFPSLERRAPFAHSYGWRGGLCSGFLSQQCAGRLRSSG